MMDVDMTRPCHNSQQLGSDSQVGCSKADNCCQARSVSSSPTKRNMQDQVHYSLMIDDFAILETIGSGTFGKVKAGLNTLTGQRVALKILNRAKMVSLDVVPKIKREIQLLARLKHPHVIQLYKVIGTPTDIFLVVEYASGGELFDYIVKRGTVMPVKDSRRFFQQIISALRYCHQRGVVHRDLKPENLLLDDKLNIKVADFGLSNMLADGALLSTSCGSPNYAAPEVIQGRHYVGPEVDVWSCGIILYVLLAGRLPFDAPSVPSLFKLIEKGAFAIPKYVPDEAGDLLRRMICVDVLERATMDTVVHHKWFRVDLPQYLFNEIDDPTPLANPDEDKLSSVTPRELLALAQHTKKTVQDAAMEYMQNPGLMTEVLKSQKKSPDDRTSSNDSGFVQSPGSCSPTFKAVNPVRPCIPEGQAFCRDDCDLCPTWGATSCLFAHRIKSLATCDLCPDNKRKGCLFSMEKLTLEDMFSPENTGVKDAQFSIGIGKVAHHQDEQKKAADGQPITLLHSIFTAPVEQQIKQMLTSRNRARPKWHLGIRSGSAPTQIMMSLFNMLKALGFEWHRVSTFHLLVRKPTDPFGNQPLISMQLFRLPRASYLIDFRSIAPPDAPEEEALDPNIVGLVHHKSSIVRYFNDEQQKKAQAQFLKKCSHLSEASRPRYKSEKVGGGGVKRLSERDDDDESPEPVKRERAATLEHAKRHATDCSSVASISQRMDDARLSEGDQQQPGSTPLSPAKIGIAHDSSVSSMDWREQRLGQIGGSTTSETSLNPSTTTLQGSTRNGSLSLDVGKLAKLFGSALFDDLDFGGDDDDDDDDGDMKMEGVGESAAVVEGKYEPNTAPLQGTQLPSSHTLRYLDACGTMINKMMGGGH